MTRSLRTALLATLSPLAFSAPATDSPFKSADPRLQQR